MTASYFGQIAIEVWEEIGGRLVLPDVLWHYTSSDGLLGIVGTSTLRFAEVSYMNDGSELKYGLELFHEVADSFFTGKPDDHREMARELEEKLIATVAHFGSVIFCLCTEKNLLNQWRDYGRDVVPYCIGFNRSSLLDREGYNFKTYLADVIYERDVQVRIMETLVSRIYEKALQIPNFGNLTDEQAVPYFSDATIQFASIVLRFKNPAFAAEREWRLITHVPDVSSRAERKFRSSSLGVIPYFEWARTGIDKKLPIVEVMVGPSPYGEVSEAGLRSFLDAKGYDQTRTSRSTIPIRR